MGILKEKEVFESEHVRHSTKRNKYIFKCLIRRVVKWNTELIGNMKQVIFLSDVGYFAMSLDS